MQQDVHYSQHLLPALLLLVWIFCVGYVVGGVFCSSYFFFVDIEICLLQAVYKPTYGRAI